MDLSGSDKPYLVVGRVGIDIFVDPPGVPVADARAARTDMGGSSANIAAGLVKLGQKSALVTCVSDDDIGTFCLNRLDHYGVDRAHVRRVSGECRTSLAFYDSVLEGHRNVIYRNNAADFQMNTGDIEALDMSAYRALITAGTVFAAEPSRGAAFLAFERAKAAGLPVIFDVDYRPYSWPSAQVASEVLSRAGAMADVIVGNDEEFGFMAGAYDKGLAKARDLSAQAAIVVYKRGPDGAITFAGGAEIETGIFAVDALKPVGAGDSFMAGMVAALSEGRPLREAILRGSACASITVSRPGRAPAMATTDELDHFLSTHPGPG